MYIRVCIRKIKFIARVTIQKLFRRPSNFGLAATRGVKSRGLISTIDLIYRGILHFNQGFQFIRENVRHKHTEHIWE